MKDPRSNLAVRIAEDAPNDATSPLSTPRRDAKSRDSKKASKFNPVNTHDLQVVKEYSNQMQSLATMRKKEAHLVGLGDHKDLSATIKKEAKQRELQNLRCEILVTVLNQAERRRLIRDYIAKQLSAEKDLANLFSQHRDEFTNYIWKRKMAQQTELRQLFATGALNGARMGALVADSTLSLVQSFERNSLATLCKDSITAGLCDADDIKGYLMPKILLLSPKTPSSTQVQINRLSFENKDPPAADPGWSCAYATAGPWGVRLSSRCLLRELTLHTVLQLSRVNRQILELRALATSAKGPKGAAAGQPPDPNLVTALNSMMNVSYISAVARLLDQIHPSHDLQTLILQNPADGASILKKRLQALGYEIPNQDTIPMSAKSMGAAERITINKFDLPTAISVVSQMDAKISRDLRFYIEFASSVGALWRAGVISMNAMSENVTNVYPGYNSFSVGISSEGAIWHDGKEYPYIQDAAIMKGIRTFGLIVDMFAGSIHLVVDGKIQPPAFGKSAIAFSESEQEAQKSFIMNQHLIPMFSLQGQVEKPLEGNKSPTRQYGRTPMMKVNFGGNTFTFHPNASPCDNALTFCNTKCEQIDASDYLAENKLADNDVLTPAHALEKQALGFTLLPEPLRSFSHFPPSVYRRAMAASTIQHAWRRYKGRQYRRDLRKQIVRAVRILQKCARKFLVQLHVFKNIAAEKIQKTWRIRLFRHYAILRLRYGKPLKSLNFSAMLIQKAYRRWHVYRNSPIALKYKRKIEDVVKAAVIIQRWWRSLIGDVRESYKEYTRYHAATNIQRVWRGYSLRQVLRPEIRARLRMLGESIISHRDELIRIRATYILQKWWRKVLHRRVRSMKLSIRNRAAAKIQACWKGYWVRTHTHLRFSYAESVFLEAVCRGLRNAHFIIKVYKPCGIVCGV